MKIKINKTINLEAGKNAYGENLIEVSIPGIGTIAFNESHQMEFNDLTGLSFKMTVGKLAGELIKCDTCQKEFDYYFLTEGIYCSGDHRKQVHFCSKQCKDEY